ncbi:MAG: glycosyltransferase family 2 protein [Clostridia bacterium]|nr:glycosyltransferase family 2 protein [Clostridia bacterium]
MKAAFVILHYLTAADTIACIESILTVLQQPEPAIVVVDNHSANGSLEILQSRFGHVERIHFVMLKANLGFARGNNAGYQYAKQKLGADWIILINNDTQMIQPDFLDQLQREYQNAPFAVLGPDILTADGRHQNPKALHGYSAAALARKIRSTRHKLLLNRVWLYEALVIWDQLRHQKCSPELKIKEQPSRTQPELWQNHQENVVLHGSCLVLSPDYTAKFKGLFDGTFLYCEEEILWSIAQVESLRLVYCPDLKIRHLEDRSTVAQHQNKRRKRLFKLRHELDSLQQLQQILENPAQSISTLLESSNTIQQREHEHVPH